MQRSKSLSLEHLVGTNQEGWWNFDAEYLCSRQIDDHFELRRLLHRQLRGAGTLQNLANIDAGLTICFANACAIANQATSIGILSPRVDCWQGMPDTKGSNLVTSEL